MSNIPKSTPAKFRMSIRNKLFGDQPLYAVVEEIFCGLAFIAVIVALGFLYITL